MENIGPGREPKYTYTAKEADATGLLYYGARYYDPVLARFLTADTVYDAGPQGLNRYSYALNNPIVYRDPTGNLSYTGDDNPAVWENPRSPEEIPLTLGPEKTDETDNGAYIDLGDGVRAKKLPPWEADPDRWPSLRAQPRRSFWRTNPVSRYIGDVIMTGRSLVSSDYRWEHCNPITGDCYLPGESFDRKFMVIMDGVLMTGTMKAERLSKAAITTKKVKDASRRLIGKEYPTKRGYLGKPQPYNPATGRYLPFSANSSLKMSPIARFGAGLGIALAEGEGAGSGAIPVGMAGNLGYATGQVINVLKNLF